LKRGAQIVFRSRGNTLKTMIFAVVKGSRMFGTLKHSKSGASRSGGSLAETIFGEPLQKRRKPITQDLKLLEPLPGSLLLIVGELLNQWGGGTAASPSPQKKGRIHHGGREKNGTK